jgi:hypothetical protein
MWKPFAGVLAMLLSVQANAAKRSWTQQDILHEMSSEFAYCASYYGISQTCAERSGAKELALVILLLLLGIAALVKYLRS